MRRAGRTCVGRRAAVAALAGLAWAGCGTGGARDLARPAAATSLASRTQVPPPEGEAPRAHLSFRTATGQVVSWDSGRRVLVLRAAGEETSFVVAADARLWVGTRHVALDRLAASLGAQATVAYAEREGVRTTHTVRLARGRAQEGDR
jgi:hypothetical protein